MSYRILTEASGSLISSYLIKAIQNAGHVAVASDLRDDIVAKSLANDFIQTPATTDPDHALKMIALLEKHKIDIVIPSLDETMLWWAQNKKALSSTVIISDTETIKTCSDKWLTYEFFIKNNIPTPQTSLKHDYKIVKPRQGRGGMQVLMNQEPTGSSLNGFISQQQLHGAEYTIDILCDKHNKPIYIIPRSRDFVKDGKSISSTTKQNEEIISYCTKICSSLPFAGPINVQCFDDPVKGLCFTEINARIAGGMALGFAATENWIKLIVDHFRDGLPLKTGPIDWELTMHRYYAECFIKN